MIPGIFRTTLISTVLLLGLGCSLRGFEPAAQPAESREALSLAVAVAPVTLASALEREGGEYRNRYREPSIHVGHYLAEALQEHHISVITPKDSAAVLEDLPMSSDFHRDASTTTRTAVSRLGVARLLFVQLTAWAPRSNNRESSRGATVGFKATLHGGPEGLLLWSGEFHEHQVSFLKNPWRMIQYPGRGTRWLSVTELARWGARRLIAEIPVSVLER